MSKRKVYHVTKSPKEGWDIKLAGSSKNTGHSATKEGAVKKGKRLAKNAVLGQLKIHKLDGTIQIEYTYRNDPRSIRG